MADIVETAITTTNTETINMETIIKEWEVAMELPRPIIWDTDTEAATVNLGHLQAWTTMECNRRREDSTSKTTITTKGNHRDQMVVTSSSSNNPTFTSNRLDCKAPQTTLLTPEVLGCHLDLLLEEDRTWEETGSETIRHERGVVTLRDELFS